MFNPNFNPYNNPYYPQNTGATPDNLAMYKQPYQMVQMPVKMAGGLLFVLNESEAMSYPVAPNNTVTLWDKDKPTIYVKTVDAQGVPSMRILDFTERTTANMETSNVEYAKKEDFEKLQAQVNEILTKYEKAGSE